MDKVLAEAGWDNPEMDVYDVCASKENSAWRSGCGKLAIYAPARIEAVAGAPSLGGTKQQRRRTLDKYHFGNDCGRRQPLDGSYAMLGGSWRFWDPHISMLDGKKNATLSVFLFGFRRFGAPARGAMRSGRARR
jgi:hypothetical protein